MNDITETLIRDTIAHPTNVTIERDGGYTMYHSFIDSGESVLSVPNEIPPPIDVTLDAYIDPSNRGFLSAIRNWLDTDEEEDGVVYEKVSPLVLLGIQIPSSVNSLDESVRNNAHLKGYLARTKVNGEDEAAVEETTGAIEDKRVTFREWVIKQTPNANDSAIDQCRRLYAPQNVYDSILRSLNTLLMGHPTTNILCALDVPAVTNIERLNITNASWTALRAALQASNNAGVAYLWDHAGETALSWFAMVPVNNSQPALCTALINNEIYVAYPVTDENGEIVFAQRVLAPGKFRLNDYVRYAPPGWVPCPIGYEMSVGFPAGGRRRRVGVADEEEDAIGYDSELVTTAFEFPLKEMLIPPREDKLTNGGINEEDDDDDNEEERAISNAENHYISKYMSHSRRYRKKKGGLGWSCVPYQYKQSESASNIYEYALGDLF